LISRKLGFLRVRVRETFFAFLTWPEGFPHSTATALGG
jgi:hypothetical protein